MEVEVIPTIPARPIMKKNCVLHARGLVSAIVVKVLVYAIFAKGLVK